MRAFILPKATLEQWLIVPFPQPIYLQGVVYKHPNPEIHDGDFVWADCIERIDWEWRQIITVHTLYIMGRPSLEWIEWLRRYYPIELASFRLEF